MVEGEVGRRGVLLEQGQHGLWEDEIIVLQGHSRIDTRTRNSLQKSLSDLEARVIEQWALFLDTRP